MRFFSIKAEEKNKYNKKYDVVVVIVIIITIAFIYES